MRFPFLPAAGKVHGNYLVLLSRHFQDIEILGKKYNLHINYLIVMYPRSFKEITFAVFWAKKNSALT